MECVTSKSVREEASIGELHLQSSNETHFSHLKAQGQRDAKNTWEILPSSKRI
jgi:hypothetical protein